MKLILIEDVPDLGVRGEVVDVADGYGRNYLVPKGKAVKATDGALAQAEAMKQARLDAERKALEEAQAIAANLTGARIVVAARSGDEGRLFGSIGDADAAEAIKKFTGVEVDRKIISISDPIKEIGLHDVELHPHPEVTFSVTLDVIPA